MNKISDSGRHYVEVFVIGILTVTMALLLLVLPFWQKLNLSAYDYIATQLTLTQNQTDIVIITIDDASFTELQTAWPWPREWYAELIARLNQAGVRLIAFDMIFDAPSAFGNADDQSLADAIAGSVPVIMGAYQQRQLLAEGLQITSVEPLNLFQDAGVFPADVSVQPDSDGVLRQFPPSQYPFWSEVLFHFTGKDVELSQFEGKDVRFTGPPETFPKVSFYRAVDATLLPDEVFADKIVFVGLDVLAAAEVGISGVDRYPTPHYFIGKTTMAGVEFHANALENARFGQPVSRLQPPQLTASIVLMALFSAFIFSRWQLLKSALLLTISLSATSLFTWFALSKHSLMIPLFDMLLPVLLAYILQGIAAYYQEHRQRLYITQAFGKYVSGSVLDQLLANPDNLAIGGRHKSITIMFTDLAGFTQLSESLPAHQVADILQEHLSQSSEIVMAKNGTLDKYIGDALMAFWGAPVDDNNQADNALNAAIEMQKACYQYSEQLQMQNLPGIAMRIGLHSGDAIVGNMGSRQLFDYSCIGDNVNLASRIEGINKYYGTDLMMTGTFVKNLTKRDNLVQLDFVRVKGKQKPVSLFCVCDSSNSINLIKQAWCHYQQRQWSEAKSLYSQLAESDKKFVTYATLLSQRIDSIEQGESHLFEDGSVAFNEK